MEKSQEHNKGSNKNILKMLRNFGSDIFSCLKEGVSYKSYKYLESIEILEKEMNLIKARLETGEDKQSLEQQLKTISESYKEKILKSNSRGKSKYLNSLGKTKKVGDDVAKIFIENGKIDWVIYGIKNFEKLSKNTAQKLMEYTKNKPMDIGTETVVLYSDLFEGLDTNIAIEIIGRGYSNHTYGILSKRQNFQDLNYKDIFEKIKNLIKESDKNQYGDIEKEPYYLIIARYYYLFKEADKDGSMFDELTNKGYGRYIKYDE